MEIYGPFPGLFRFFGTGNAAAGARDAVNSELSQAGATAVGGLAPLPGMGSTTFGIGYSSGRIGIVETVTLVQGSIIGTWTSSGTAILAYAAPATWARFIQDTGGGTIGGTVSGLEGMGLVLTLGNFDQPIEDNGPFVFEGVLWPPFEPYDVTVLTQPEGQVCIVTNGSGEMPDQGSVDDVLVACGPAAEPVTIGGSVTGLEGEGSDLVLQNNLTDDEPIAADGEFTFDTPLQPGGTYSVTVLTNPTNPAQDCFVVRGSGPVPYEDVTNVAVLCAPPDEGPPPPEEDTVCTRELCAADEDLQEECETFLAACLVAEPNEDECVGGALLICGELF
ncbi:MAG: hypothetical protein KJP05_02300 [Deltaproteobacteria bacterium]|nr:hypothetical protein [Deltaproteobacteria bacterium]